MGKHQKLIKSISIGRCASLLVNRKKKSLQNSHLQGWQNQIMVANCDCSTWLLTQVGKAKTVLEKPIPVWYLAYFRACIPDGCRHIILGCFCKAGICTASDSWHLPKLCFVLSNTGACGGGLRFFFKATSFLLVVVGMIIGTCHFWAQKSECNMLSVLHSGVMWKSYSTYKVVAFDLEPLTWITWLK